MIDESSVTEEELGISGMKILQSAGHYRFTSDAIKLTRFAPRVSGRIADFCSGCGIVALHYYALNPSPRMRADLFEVQTPLAELSERSISLNGLDDRFAVHNIRVQDIGAEYNGAFSLILCNPPYERAGSGEESLGESDRIARHEVSVTLGEIIEAARLKLKFGGRLCICHRADRLAEVLSAMRNGGIEPKRLELVRGKGGKIYLALIEGVRGGKTGLDIKVA